jgi:hypothetical protein
MIEKEMEDLLWGHPEEFFGEKLTQFERQSTSDVGRSDLIFIDRIGRYLVVEVKHGKLRRGAVPQLQDYYGMMKHRFPNSVVELIVVANQIPDERRLACENLNIEAIEIPEKKFRDVASEVNYIFESERTAEPARRDDTLSKQGPQEEHAHSKRPSWPISYQTKIRLAVPPDEALKLLKQVSHENFLKTLDSRWQVDKDGNVKAQSICWFFCWAKTGNSSPDARDTCRSIFDRIFDKTYGWFDSKVDHEWAQKARYKKRSIEADLERRLLDC